ncbi:VWA domain-containing protein [Rhodopirellula sp. JC639]|uniref:VWA domain-containing protein n=1 Tax=Stieleria mannarensis TaxID=2755585 RepID=UPI0015FF32BB|nr:VWA domain-containing protein [Rhodopirellula sp. JC639]
MWVFAHPVLLALLPLPLIIRWFIPPSRQPRPAVRVPFLPRLVASQVQPIARSTSTGRSTQAVTWTVWTLLVIALARPQVLQPPIERTVPTRDLLLLVDLSGSMQHEDFTDASGQTVDRLAAVKEVLGEFLLHRQGDRVGLVVFGNSPFLQVPFSTDLELSRRLLEETAVGMAGPRTALGDAIGLGIELFKRSDAPAKTMIALTDGNDNASAVPPREAARVARDRQITIHTIAMGDPTTVGEEKIDEEELKSVAKATGGEMFLALDRGELAKVYQQLDEIETREEKTIRHQPRRDVYHVPVAAALLLSFAACAWSLLVGRVKRVAADSQTRLRVNPRTFELEVTET